MSTMRGTPNKLPQSIACRDSDEDDSGESWRIGNIAQPNTPHFCRCCKVGFRDRILLNNHLKLHNTEWAFDSNPVSETVTVRETTVDPHPTPTFRCLTCKESFLSISHLKVHSEVCRALEDASWQCDICEDIFENKILLNAHFASLHCHEEEPVECPHCQLFFDNSEDLKIHIEIDHEPESPQKKTRKMKDSRITVACECGKVFITELDYQEHMLEEHPGMDPIKWPKDLNEIKRRRQSSNQQTVKPPRKRYLEAMGGVKRGVGRPRKERERERERMLAPVIQERSPMHVYRDPAPDERGTLWCVECGEMFTKHVELKRHMQTYHQHLKPYACSICGRRFTRKSDVKRHIETIHGQAVSREDLDRIQAIRPFRCAKCGNPFGRYADIRKHIEVHHGLIFSPDTYIYQLEHTDELGLSIGTSGEQVNIRTFDCGLCKRKYRNKTTVRHHIRKDHNQENPDSFITRSHYDHNDNLDCQFCGDVFSSVEDRIDHVNGIHQMNEECHVESVQLAEVIQQDANEDGEEDCLMPVKDVSTPEKRQRPKSGKSQYIVILKQEVVNPVSPHPAPLEHRMEKKDNSWCQSLMNDIVSEQGPNKDKENYDCPECSRSFTRLRALQQHIEKMHAQKGDDFDCEMCGKSYKKQAQFVKHLQIAHPEVGPKAPNSKPRTPNQPPSKPTESMEIVQFSCEICNKTFASNDEQIVHFEVVHKPSYLSKILSVPLNPKPHSVTVSEDLPMMEYYTCSICETMFSSTESLTRHMNVKHKNVSSAVSTPAKTVMRLDEGDKLDSTTESVPDSGAQQDVSIEYT